MKWFKYLLTPVITITLLILMGTLEGPWRLIRDSSGNIIEFDDSSRVGTVPHEHSGHGDIHFHLDGVATGNFVFIDLSDSTNYPHIADSTVIHIEDIFYEIDSDVTGDYEIGFLYLENCDATDCDSRMFWAVSGTRTAGNSLHNAINWGANGPILQSGEGGTIASSNMTTLNDTTYNTATNFKSTLNVASATVPAGNGDIIMRITLNAGTIDIHFTVSYHTHDADHD